MKLNRKAEGASRISVSVSCVPRYADALAASHSRRHVTPALDKCQTLTLCAAGSEHQAKRTRVGPAHNNDLSLDRVIRRYQKIRLPRLVNQVTSMEGMARPELLAFLRPAIFFMVRSRGRGAPQLQCLAALRLRRHPMSETGTANSEDKLCSPTALHSVLK